MTTAGSIDWTAKMRELGEDFATRTAKHDEEDSFVAENYVKLKEHGALSAGVPGELGGGNASHAELCAMIRELARHCSSTGLAFSMHTHLIATLAYLWRAGNKAPEGILKRVAAENLVLISTGGSDWLPGSGKLEKVEGGFRMNGRKIFGSGVLAGDIFMTTGIYDDPSTGPTVIHFPLPVKSDGVKILDTWKAHGMRGTGSQDVLLENVFVPDAAMGGVRRPPGKWHPFMHAVATVALPVFYAAYLGVAEHARDLALKLAASKKNDPLVQMTVGEMENQLITAQITHASMVELVTTEKISPATTNAQCARRNILANAMIRCVEKAMEVGGGAAFYRSAGLERAWRDIQGARYHPVPDKQQTRMMGRHLLGLEIDL